MKHKETRFDVFLCHNSVDKIAVKKIGEQLEREGIRVWLDEWQLRPGFPWQRVLEEQIEIIKSAAVFVGSDGVGPWQNLELEAFLREFVDRKCPVIPVILPGVDKNPGLPVFLRGMTWVDFRKKEPDPLKQLIWGIAGESRKSLASSPRAAHYDGAFPINDNDIQAKRKSVGIEALNSILDNPRLPATLIFIGSSCLASTICISHR